MALLYFQHSYSFPPQIHAFNFFLIDIKDVSSFKEQIEKPIEVKEIIALKEARDLIMNKILV